MAELLDQKWKKALEAYMEATEKKNTTRGLLPDACPYCQPICPSCGRPYSNHYQRNVY